MGCSAMRRQIAERRQNCNALCQQALAAKNEGWPDQADLLLNEALRQRPDDRDTRRRLADAMWECGRRQDAIDEYQELVQSHPKDAGLHQRLAVMSWTAGQRELAARSADQALQLDPTAAEAMLIKARVEAFEQRFDAAVATYIRLSRLAPDMIAAKLELAEVHVERGHSHQACTLLREVVALPHLTPAELADAEWKLGLAYASADRWTEASAHLEKSIGNRAATSADWQMLMLAKSQAGEEIASLQSKAVQASATQPAEPENSHWQMLRDRLILRSGTMAQTTSTSGGIIRADFSKQAARPQ